MIGCHLTKKAMDYKNKISGKYSSLNNQFHLNIRLDSSYSYSVTPDIYTDSSTGYGVWTSTHNGYLILLDSILKYGLDAQMVLVDSNKIDSIKVDLEDFTDFASMFCFIDGDTFRGDLFEKLGAFKYIDSIKVVYGSWDRRNLLVQSKTIATKNLKGEYKFRVDKPPLQERHLLNDTLTELGDRRNRIKGLKFDNGLTLYRVLEKTTK